MHSSNFTAPFHFRCDAAWFAALPPPKKSTGRVVVTAGRSASLWLPAAIVLSLAAAVVPPPPGAAPSATFATALGAPLQLLLLFHAALAARAPLRWLPSAAPPTLEQLEVEAHRILGFVFLDPFFRLGASRQLNQADLPLLSHADSSAEGWRAFAVRLGDANRADFAGPRRLAWRLWQLVKPWGYGVFAMAAVSIAFMYLRIAALNRLLTEMATPGGADHGGLGRSHRADGRADGPHVLRPVRRVPRQPDRRDRAWWSRDDGLPQGGLI